MDNAMSLKNKMKHISSQIRISYFLQNKTYYTIATEENILASHRKAVYKKHKIK